MTPERYQRIKAIFQAALEKSTAEREAFVTEECVGDPELRSEVESMLAHYFSDFLEDRVSGEALDELNEGETLGRFTIMRRLGRGGMGEVFLARDESLRRDVAVKVLLPEFAADEDRVIRFKQEARAASALNHPNIVTVYDIGEDRGRLYLATEYVDGQTLAELIERGPLEPERAREIGIKVLAALEQAHRANVIHRDIKPSNIIVSNGGIVKLVDFGLAKFINPSDIESPISGAIVMGTVPYMSPEQLRGRLLDTRSDLFSFGVVLYEMLTARSPFQRPTNADTISAILHQWPDLSLLPVGLRGFAADALAKNREDRFPSASAALARLGELAISDAPSRRAASVAPETVGNDPYPTADGARTLPIFWWESRWKQWTALATMAIVLAGGGAFFWRNGSIAEPATPKVTQIVNWKRDLGEEFESSARFAPDGSRFVFASTRGGTSSIWSKAIGGGDPVRLTIDDGTPDRSPIFTPDGLSVIYLSDENGATGIWRVAATGGESRLLTRIDGRGQRLVRASKIRKSVYFEHGKSFFELDLESLEIRARASFEQWSMPGLRSDISPDESRLAFVAESDTRTDVFSFDLASGASLRLTNDDFIESYLVWAPDGGRVIFDSVRNGISQIFSVGMDGASPSPLVLSDNTNYVSEISSDGKRVLYYSQRDEADLWKVNVRGGDQSAVARDAEMEFWSDPGNEGDPVLMQVQRTNDVAHKVVGSAIVRIDPATGTRSEIAGEGYSPRRSPDGNSTAFLKSSSGTSELWLSAPGSEPRKMTAGGVMFGGYSLMPFVRLQPRDFDWSPDGRSIMFSAIRDGVSNIWKVDVETGSEARITANDDRSVILTSPTWSTDGNRLAYLAFAFKDRRSQIRLRDGVRDSLLIESSRTLRIVGWVDSGKLVVAQADGRAVGPIEIIEVEDGIAKPASSIASGYLHSVNLSGDGRMTAYVVRKDGVDRLMVATGKSPPVELARSDDSRIFLANPVFSADSRAVFFEKQSSWQSISLLEDF